MIYCPKCNAFYFKYDLLGYELQCQTGYLVESIKHVEPDYIDGYMLLSDAGAGLYIERNTHFICENNHKTELPLNYFKVQYGLNKMIINDSDYNFIISLIHANKIDLNNITIEDAFKLKNILTTYIVEDISGG